MEGNSDEKEVGSNQVVEADLINIGDVVDLGKEGKLEISLNAMIGAPCPRTMRMVGRINQVDVIILVDIGSTHNFLDPKVAKWAY